MTEIEMLKTLLSSTPKPKCADLIPFKIIEGDKERGYVKVEFEEQPAFGNLFGYIQGGFLSAMMEVPVSLAGLLKTGAWLLTIEMKTSYFAPAKIGACIAEGQVLRSGRKIVFVEGRLWGIDGKLATHVTATLLGPKLSPAVNKE
jgi:uncharacterized protein (TIGR00369 family)